MEGKWRYTSILPTVFPSHMYVLAPDHLWYLSLRPLGVGQVQLRFGVRGQSKEDVERFTKELAPLILTGPPAVTGFAGGRPKVEEIMAYFPALIPKDLIETKVEILEA